MRTAVALFTYNRPHYLKKAIKTHRKVNDVFYYAYIDHSEKQDEVYDIIVSKRLYGGIVKRSEKMGLNNSIISGINQLFTLYDSVIVLEDDLLLSRDAIRYLVNQLIVNEKDKNCFAVSLYKDEPFSNTFRCWGWGTWKDRWQEINWSVARGSWDVILTEYMRMANLYCKCSDKQRVKHIGYKGTHYSYKDLFVRWLKR